jgi:hypothetical protein
MVILGFAFWIGWHVIQTRQENAEIESEDDMPEENGWRGLPQNAEATRCRRKRRPGSAHCRFHRRRTSHLHPARCADNRILGDDRLVFT